MTEAIIKDARATPKVDLPMEDITKVFRLTENMLQAARSGEWEMLANLQQERERSVRSTENLAYSQAQFERVLHTFRQVLSLNKEIVSITEAECRHRQAQLEVLHRSQHAVNCYKMEARGM